MIRWLRSGVATLIMSSVALGAAVQPAKADTTSTLLITAAAVAALMTGINVAEKNAKANQLVGYLPNGSPVYADGHVVTRTGQTWYPGNQGENISCNGGRCVLVSAYGGYPGNYGYPGYGGYPGYSAYPASYGGYPGYGAYPSSYGAYPAGYGAYPASYGGYPANYGGGYYPSTNTTTINRYVTTTHKTIIERRKRDRAHDRVSPERFVSP